MSSAKAILDGLVYYSLAHAKYKDAIDLVKKYYKDDKHSEIGDQYIVLKVITIKSMENGVEELSVEMVEELVDNLVEDEIFSAALRLVDLYFYRGEKKGKEAGYLMELKARILYKGGNHGASCEILAEIVEGKYGEGVTIESVESGYIYGEALLKAEDYETAFDILSQALRKAEETGNKIMVEKLTRIVSECGLLLGEVEEKKAKEDAQRKKDEEDAQKQRKKADEKFKKEQGELTKTMESIRIGDQQEEDALKKAISDSLIAQEPPKLPTGEMKKEEPKVVPVDASATAIENAKKIDKTKDPGKTSEEKKSEFIAEREMRKEEPKVVLVDTSTATENAKEIDETKDPGKTSEEKKSEYIAEISIKFTYLLRKHLGRRLYEGIKICEDRTWPKLFVGATPDQIKNIDMLIKMGAESKFMVTVDHDINHALSDLLVVEPLVPLKHFFKIKCDQFGKSDLIESNRSSWWKFIRVWFTQIFGDVMHGLMYLRSLDYTCGDLEDLVFVDQNVRGKILSLLDNQKFVAMDIQNLLHIMQDIITLPFKDKKMDKSYGLPFELTKFFHFLSHHKSNIPSSWLYNYPIIWSSQEKVNFITGLIRLMKEGIISKDWLKKPLHKCYSNQGLAIGVKINRKINWTVTIDIPLFQAILERAQNDSSITEYDEESPIEIPRYMNACYGHVNDDIYEDLRGKDVKYSPFEIEECLSRFFKGIYVILYEALCAYTLQFDKGSKTMKNAFKAFNEWSCLYFTKMVPSTGKDTNEVFRSIYTESKINKPGPSFAAKSVDWNEMPDMESLPQSLRDLLACAKNLGNYVIDILMEEEIMGFFHVLSFGREEMVRLVQKKELEAIHVSMYMRLLYEENERNFGFMCPTSISPLGRSENDRIDYVECILRKSKREVFLAPYNIGVHWVLCVIDRSRYTVQYLDPKYELELDCEDLKNVVNTALRRYLSGVEKKITWRTIECPQQTNMIDCGYYVLRFIREIVARKLYRIPTQYFDDRGSEHFNQDEINEVRDELASHILHFASSQEFT